MKKENVLIAAMVLVVSLLFGCACLMFFLGEPSFSRETLSFEDPVDQTEPSHILTKAEKLVDGAEFSALENDNLLLTSENNGDETRALYSSYR